MDRDRRRRESGLPDPFGVFAESEEVLERELANFRAEVARARAEIDAEIAGVRREVQENAAALRREVAANSRPWQDDLLLEHQPGPRYRAGVVFFDGSHAHFFSTDGYLFYERDLPRIGKPEPSMFLRTELEDGVLPTPAYSIIFSEYQAPQLARQIPITR